MAMVEEYAYDAAPGTRYRAAKVLDRDEPITVHRQTLKEGCAPLWDHSWETDLGSEMWFYTLSDAQEYAAQMAAADRMADEEASACGF